MIKFAHAYKMYPGPVHALKDINLEVEKGEFVFLTGPSGAGKTTLFRLLSAYDRSTSGHIHVLGQNLEKMTQHQVPFYRRRIGVVYQDFRLLKRKTVEANVSLPLEVKNEKEKYINERVSEVLDQVGLSHKRYDYPEHLSGGEQQRVAIARAIIHRPSLLIADEPTGNLDPYLADEIIRLFDKINAQGTTVFIATHDFSIVKKYARKTLELKDGQLKEAK